MGLEHAGEDHAHPVERHLEGEHAQEARDQADLGGRVGPLGDREEPGHRVGQQRQARPQGQDHQEHDAQQAAGGLLGLTAPASAGGGGQQGHDGGRQGAADHHLVQDVGDLVGGGVGARHRPGAHGGGLHHQGVQEGGGLNDLCEGDPLTGQDQGGGGPGRHGAQEAAGVGRQGGPHQGPQGVGAGVPQHGAFHEVLGQGRGRGAQRPGGEQA